MKKALVIIIHFMFCAFVLIAAKIFAAPVDDSGNEVLRKSAAIIEAKTTYLLRTGLFDSNGTSVGTPTNPLNVTQYSEVPDYEQRSAKVVTAGTSNFNAYTMAASVGLTSFTFGGRGPGQASLWRVDTTASEFIPGGGFNSSGDVSLWTNASAGSSAALTWAYSNAQAYEGTGSATVTFTQSDQNNFPAIKYTFATPKDVSQWRYVNARAYVTVAAGGAQTRTLSVILTDSGGGTRTYSLAGTTTTPPFSTAQFNQVLGELESPTSETGTFDTYNVSSITLKLVDGGNKSGTIYWDDVKFTYGLTLLERIYVAANSTTQLQRNPSATFSAGQVVGISFRNNDTVSREFTVTARGVER